MIVMNSWCVASMNHHGVIAVVSMEDVEEKPGQLETAKQQSLASEIVVVLSLEKARELAAVEPHGVARINPWKVLGAHPWRVDVVKQDSTKPWMAAEGVQDGLRLPSLRHQGGSTKLSAGS
jgi:hypothetical protein